MSLRPLHRNPEHCLGNPCQIMLDVCISLIINRETYKTNPVAVLRDTRTYCLLCFSYLSVPRSIDGTQPSTDAHVYGSSSVNKAPRLPALSGTCNSSQNCFNSASISFVRVSFLYDIGRAQHDTVLFSPIQMLSMVMPLIWERLNTRSSTSRIPRCLADSMDSPGAGMHH